MTLNAQGCKWSFLPLMDCKVVNLMESTIAGIFYIKSNALHVSKYISREYAEFYMLGLSLQYEFEV